MIALSMCSIGAGLGMKGNDMLRLGVKSTELGVNENSKWYAIEELGPRTEADNVITNKQYGGLG